MSTKTRILSIVLREQPIFSADVIALTGIAPKSVRGHLLRLYRDDKVLDRHKAGRKKRYAYFALEGAGERVRRILDGVPEEEEEVETWAELPGDSAVDAAIAAARPRWKEASLPALPETVGCPRCRRAVLFEPWHADELLCPVCGWPVQRHERS